MLKFVIDEDMPRSTGRILKQRGYEVKDIRKEQRTKRFMSLHKESKP